MRETVQHVMAICFDNINKIQYKKEGMGRICEK